MKTKIHLFILVLFLTIIGNSYNAMAQDNELITALLWSPKVQSIQYVESPIFVNFKEETLSIDEKQLTSIKFKQKSHSFGRVKQGEKVEHVYSFKNIGKYPLEIIDATGTCGCAVPEWTKEPIGVGETGEVKVVFDTKDKLGKQYKTVTLTVNTADEFITVRMIGTVLPNKNVLSLNDKLSNSLKVWSNTIVEQEMDKLKVFYNVGEKKIVIEKPILIKTASLTIYSSYGVSQKMILIDDNEVEINRDDLGTGLYFYTIKNENIIKNGRFFVE